VARVLPRTYAVYRRLIAHAKAERPDVFVAIDSPDFNFFLAKAMRRLGVPVVYYISPQLWAWRPGRMKTMQRIADRVLVIFPFEEEIYRRADVPVEWVGHPLLDVSSAPRPRAEFLESLGLDPDKPLVAILPGSRINEVRAILPRLLDAAKIIHGRLPAVQFVLARAPHLGDALFSELASGPAITMVANATDDVLAAADLGLLASGTVTVQAALRECPMIVVYRLSPLTYRLGRRFVHVNTFAMANLVAGRTVVPELEQDAFTPEAVAREALGLLENPERAAAMRRELREVRAKLGEPGASRRAAEAVLAVARAGRAQRLG